MGTQAIKIPQPLDGEEVKNGVALRISRTFTSLTEAQRIALRDSIWAGLNNTCTLNRQSYAKFEAQWSVSPFESGAQWKVSLTLDDFGRPVQATMTGLVEFAMSEVSGTIPAEPPDKFRRETDQPIPQPQVVQKKAENQAGITRSVGRPRKVRDT